MHNIIIMVHCGNWVQRNCAASMSRVGWVVDVKKCKLIVVKVRSAKSFRFRREGAHPPHPLRPASWPCMATPRTTTTTLTNWCSSSNPSPPPLKKFLQPTPLTWIYKILQKVVVSPACKTLHISLIIYINDLPLSVTSASCYLFADDTKLLHAISNEADHHLFQEGIEQVDNWCQQWNLSLNADKINATLSTSH